MQRMTAFPFTSKMTFDEHGWPQLDRGVTSEVLRKVLRSYYTNGVFGISDSNCLQVFAPSDGSATVKVKPGVCLINGATGYTEEAISLDLTAGDASLPRIDTVVARLNDNTDYRAIYLDIIIGTPATTPQAPTLTQSDSIWEIGLANIRRAANSTVITDRQKLSYACQCIGCFAKMDELGRLEVKWYDFNNPVNVSTTFNGKSLWTAPITVTGLQIELSNGSFATMEMSVDGNGVLNYIRSSDVGDTFEIDSSGRMIANVSSGATYTVNAMGELVRTGEEITVPSENNSNGNITVLYGTDDRIIKISGNPYITVANLKTICENISESIFGKEFRPGTLPVLANPCLQAGDVLEVADRNTGLVYMIPITSTSYNKTLSQSVICAFEQKSDADLRPTSNYNMRVSVEDAMAQAQAADELARNAQSIAEESGLQPIVVSSKGTAFAYDTTATLTAVIYDRESTEVDPQGTDYIYRWWKTADATAGRYLNGGKEIEVEVADSLCDYSAGIYFEVLNKDRSIYPFTLSKRNDAVLLTTRDGTLLTARAADGVQT